MDLGKKVRTFDQPAPIRVRPIVTPERKEAPVPERERVLVPLKR